MFWNRSSKICVQILPLVVLNVIALGNGNFLNELSHDFAAPTMPDSNKFVKGEDRTPAINKGLVTDEGVGAVGEVFVPKTFPLSSQEPTCEQLRAMWIFSKRQSRAAEITNEIPTYRDPFSYNVWEPLYSNSRMQGQLRMVARERTRSPVFGRVVSREPIGPLRTPFDLRPNNAGQPKLYGSELRPMGIPTQLVSSPSTSSPRLSSKNRFMGSATSSAIPNSAVVQGSFQKLKELIWTERAKELTQQRRTEELAARTAMLKEIANGKNIPASYKTPLEKPVDTFQMDENRSPDPIGNSNLNYQRMSIANRQIFEPNQKDMSARPRINGGRPSTRRIGSKYGSYYSTKSSSIRRPKETSDRAGISKTDKEKMSTIDQNEGNPEQAVIGISRTYPYRQSHFRERNRSLMKENFPKDFFQRNTRKLKTYDQNETRWTPFSAINYDSKTTASGLFYRNNDSTKDKNLNLFPNNDNYEYNLYDYGDN